MHPDDDEDKVRRFGVTCTEWKGDKTIKRFLRGIKEAQQQGATAATPAAVAQAPQLSKGDALAKLGEVRLQEGGLSRDYFNVHGLNKVRWDLKTPGEVGPSGMPPASVLHGWVCQSALEVQGLHRQPWTGT